MLVRFIYGKQERYIDLSPNFGTVRDCESCGAYNIREKRVDTESVWGSVDSYCLACWYREIKRRAY